MITVPGKQKDMRCSSRRGRKNPQPSGNEEALSSTVVAYKAKRHTNRVSSVTSSNEASSKVIMIDGEASVYVTHDKALFSSIEEIDTV